MKFLSSSFVNPNGANWHDDTRDSPSRDLFARVQLRDARWSR